MKPNLLHFNKKKSFIFFLLLALALVYCIYVWTLGNSLLDGKVVVRKPQSTGAIKSVTPYIYAFVHSFMCDHDCIMHMLDHACELVNVI